VVACAAVELCGETRGRRACPPVGGVWWFATRGGFSRVTSGNGSVLSQCQVILTWMDICLLLKKKTCFSFCVLCRGEASSKLIVEHFLSSKQKFVAMYDEYEPS